jgi:hypothetical protein
MLYQYIRRIRHPAFATIDHAISLLSIFNKLLEKRMCYSLLDFLKKKNVLYANQFGFRRNYSTEYAILKITDKIQRAIDEHDYSLGIFLDFSDAFDTVNHEILIEKLNYYGIRGLPSKWFTSYLSDRQQIVKINNISYDPSTISCGVPQGSVLGPILIELYFRQVENVHNYNTRSLATQSYYLQKIRTNYGKFNVRFQRPIVWNASRIHVKSLSFKKFKKYLKRDFISKYEFCKNNNKKNNSSICLFVLHMSSVFVCMYTV